MDSFLYIFIVIFILIYFSIEFLSVLISLSDRMKVVDLHNKGEQNAAFIVEILNNKRIFIKSASFHKLMLCLIIVSLLWVEFDYLNDNSYIAMLIALLVLAFSIYGFNIVASSFLKEPERVLVKSFKFIHFYLRYNLYYSSSRVFNKLQKNFIPKSLLTYEDVSIALSSADKSLTVSENEFQEIRETLHFNNSLLNDDSLITHRIHIFALNEELTKKEAIELINQHDFKRIPVFHKNIDKIVGYIDRMVFLADYEKDSEGLVKDYQGIEKHLTLIESTNKAFALVKMLENDVSICVLLDEYGGTKGLVTKNDLIKSRNKKEGV